MRGTLLLGSSQLLPELLGSLTLIEALHVHGPDVLATDLSVQDRRAWVFKLPTITFKNRLQDDQLWDASLLARKATGGVVDKYWMEGVGWLSARVVTTCLPQRSRRLQGKP